MSKTAQGGGGGLGKKGKKEKKKKRGKKGKRFFIYRWGLREDGEGEAGQRGV